MEKTAWQLRQEEIDRDFKEFFAWADNARREIEAMYTGQYSAWPRVR